MLQKASDHTLKKVRKDTILKKIEHHKKRKVVTCYKDTIRFSIPTLSDSPRKLFLF